MRTVDRINRLWSLAATYEQKAKLAEGASKDALLRLAQRHWQTARSLERGL